MSTLSACYGEVCAPQKMTPPSDSTPRNETIVVLGDSIGAQQGVKHGKGWVELLQRHTWHEGKHMTCLNLSRGGATAQFFAGNTMAVSASVKKAAPVAVVVELGGNDQLFGAPKSEIIANLTKIVRCVSASSEPKPLVFILQMIPGSDVEKVVADETDAYLVSAPPELFHSTFKSGVRSGSFLPPINTVYFQRDGIHPNSKAQPFIVRGLLEALQNHSGFSCSSFDDVAAHAYRDSTSCSSCVLL